MKAFVYERYGGPEVLELRELPRPVPKDDEVLIRVCAATVTSGDRRVRAMDIPRGFGLISRLVFGVSAPRKQVLGVECSGVIEAAGATVTKLNVGDDVFAIDAMGMGCYAQYKVMRADAAIALKPESLTFEQAAAIPFGSATALNFMRRGELKRGETVLINGASGGVGTAAVQIAKHLGAEVTGVCSGANLDLVRSLGADHVIDYTREDFTLSGKRYDAIMDTVGTAPYARCAGSLKEGGRMLLVLADLPAMLGGSWAGLTSSKKVIAGPSTEKAEDLAYLAKLAQDGELTPFIDKRFAFEQLVEAHRYVDTGRKRGNVVVSL
jgi:NADPH:quinone reductase-like Zn-dependent oxidoreductase